MSWFNSIGLMTVIMIQMSEFACETDDDPIFVEEDKKTKIMGIAERVTKYLCWFFMTVHLWKLKFGTPNDRLILGIGTMFLLLVAFYNWYISTRRNKTPNKMMMAIVPCGIFILTGYCYRYWPLIIVGIAYSFLRIRRTSLESNNQDK